MGVCSTHYVISGEWQIILCMPMAHCVHNITGMLPYGQEYFWREESKMTSKYNEM